jgi:hypothetical protein
MLSAETGRMVQGVASRLSPRFRIPFPILTKVCSRIMDRARWRRAHLK